MVSCRLVVLVAVFVAVLGCAVRADATLVEGLGGALTLVESESGPQSEGSTLYASMGSLRDGFSTPVAISEPGDSAGTGYLVSDGTGDVLAVWSADRSYEGFNRYFAPRFIGRGVWYAWRPAGGQFSPPHQLAAPAPGQDGVSVAMDPSGEAVVGYEERGSVYIRRARANGQFGVAVKAADGSLAYGQSYPETSARLLYMGLDSDGELLMVTLRDGVLQARFAPLGQLLKRAQVIVRRMHGRFPELAGPFPFAIVATGARGDALIAWQEKLRNGSYRVLAAYRKTGGRFGSPQRLTPEEDRTFTSLQAAVVDGHGHAVLALLHVSDGSPVTLETSESSGSGRLSAPAALGTASSFGGTPSAGIVSLADNANGETAIRYQETTPAGRGLDGTPFAIDVRYSVGSQPFGPAQTLATGTIGCAGAELTPPFTQRDPGCESIPVLVGAEEHAFYSVSAFGHSLHPSSLSRVVNIQRLTQTGAGPPVQVTLPAVAFPLAPPQPASLVDLGTTAQMDSHGRIHGHIICGNHGGGSCTIQITIEQATSPRSVLARTLVKIPAIEAHPLSIILDRAARRLLAHHRTIKALIVTSTTSNTGPSTQTNYPLTLTARLK